VQPFTSVASSRRYRYGVDLGEVVSLLQEIRGGTVN
jgi:hypothetical protein